MFELGTESFIKWGPGGKILTAANTVTLDWLSYVDYQSKSNFVVPGDKNQVPNKNFYGVLSWIGGTEFS